MTCANHGRSRRGRESFDRQSLICRPLPRVLSLQARAGRLEPTKELLRELREFSDEHFRAAEPDQRPEDHRRRGDLPAPARGEDPVRQRSGRPDRQGHDRRRDHRLRRGRLEPDGRQGVHRGAVLAHDGDRAGARADRRGPVPRPSISGTRCTGPISTAAGAGSASTR